MIPEIVLLVFIVLSALLAGPAIVATGSASASSGGGAGGGESPQVSRDFDGRSLGLHRVLHFLCFQAPLSQEVHRERRKPLRSKLVVVVRL